MLCSKCFLFKLPGRTIRLLSLWKDLQVPVLEKGFFCYPGYSGEHAVTCIIFLYLLGELCNTIVIYYAKEIVCVYVV